jgi:hypothetical protein
VGQHLGQQFTNLAGIALDNIAAILMFRNSAAVSFPMSSTAGIRDHSGKGHPDFPSTYWDWDAIKPGHVVLVQDSLIGGWYEAVVVGRTADKLTLRCRDYPGYPKFTVPVLTVALLNPTAS